MESRPDILQVVFREYDKGTQRGDTLHAACGPMLNYIESLEQKIATLEAKLAQGREMFVIEYRGASDGEWHPTSLGMSKSLALIELEERQQHYGLKPECHRIRPALLIVEDNLQVISDQDDEGAK
jgi:hypothetical protein